MHKKQIDFLLSQLNIVAFVQQLTQDNCAWGDELIGQLKTALTKTQHGDLIHWLHQLNNAPLLDAPVQATLDEAIVTVSSRSSLSQNQDQALKQTLEYLKPWRKGPFQLFNTHIDSEWRSDMKWERLKGHINLKNKNILDIGCGNGYFGWRALGAGARSVTGVEPNLLFIVQFLYLKKYIDVSNKTYAHFMLPLRFEELPKHLNYYDTVFSMGVLYHRRSIFDHLYELKNCLQSGGQLILETLVIKSENGEVLVPKNRYARMRNVWFIPSSKVLCAWLERVGFVDIRIINESNTTLDEQRKTKWIDSQSLEHCLDKHNSNLTIEGYPAPRRAIIFAHKPL